MFNPGQQPRYRALVERAWQVHCLRTGQNPVVDSAHETWYRRQLMDCLGVYTTKQANPVADYDRIMLHFAQIAGNEREIDYWSRANERRLLYCIRREIRRGALAEAYVAGIARNMGFLQVEPASAGYPQQPGAFLAELPADHLWRIWNAILRHNKRHSARNLEQVPA